MNRVTVKGPAKARITMDENGDMTVVFDGDVNIEIASKENNELKEFFKTSSAPVYINGKRVN
ncbi:hypothetical protein [Paenibacillus donghaensis]|uniref:Uncharacterized protein n=1 Tax=Paenibacillus donghaensis TaxID=414771 RepID=A0A2Z2K8V7_9BACL|nr:hypothetical protein [Paenibacillus donghaensis]ASA21814.1 hypothetical protein B9T62_14150 [Paenibacillus donghaensis]